VLESIIITCCVVTKEEQMNLKDRKGEQGIMVGTTVERSDQAVK